MNWKVARAGNGRLKTENLRLLSDKEPKQELILRPGNTARWSGTRLNEKIGEKARTVEAAAMQVVGDHQKNLECEGCLKGLGPFALCVTFPGIDGCGNCHWRGFGPNCTLIPGAPPRGHKKRRSDASSLEKGEQDVAGHVLVELRDLIAKAQAAQNRVDRQTLLFTNLSPQDQAVLTELVRHSNAMQKRLQALEEAVRQAQGFGE